MISLFRRAAIHRFRCSAFHKTPFHHFPHFSLGLDVVLQFFDKGPTRLSESVSFGFSPSVGDGSYKWQLSKLDSVIDPTDVILNGSQWLHGRVAVLTTIIVWFFLCKKKK
jgi:hypothetical protein